MALDALRSGFVALCIDPRLNYFDPNARLLIEGALPQVAYAGATPATADLPVKVPSAGQGAAMFGTGVLGAAVAKAFRTRKPNVDVWVLPRTADVANVAAVYTQTFTGTATSDGRLDIFYGDDVWMASTFIASGSTPTQIAAAVLADIQAWATTNNFPYVVTAALGVLTFTAKDKGAIGNYLNPIWNYTGQPNIAPAGVSHTVVRTTAGTGDWAVTPGTNDHATLLQECCYDGAVLLSGSPTKQGLLQKWIAGNWDCTKPQCFGHGYVWNEGTLGQVLATGSNAGEFCRLPYPVNDANPPYLLVVEYAMASVNVAQANPETSIQGQTYGVLSSTFRPAACSQPWTLTERQQLSAAGFAVWGPASMGGGYMTNPMIYEDITNYLYDALGRPNRTFRATNMRRWAKAFAADTAEFLEDTFDGLAMFDSGTAIKEGVRASSPTLARAKTLAYLRTQEGVKISQITDPAKQIVFTSDMEVAAPCHGEPGNYYLQLVVGPPIRIAKITTTILPKLLDNCARS